MVVDMPYRTYQNKRQALTNARKILKETKCEAVKLEGGFKIKSIVEYLIKNKIPVMGHLGLLPQSIKGKFKSKGKTEREKNKLISESKLLESLGVFAIVLECIRGKTADLITKSISIPTRWFRSYIINHSIYTSYIINNFIRNCLHKIFVKIIKICCHSIFRRYCSQ